MDVWTYDIELWDFAKTLNIDKIQILQSKTWL